MAMRMHMNHLKIENCHRGYVYTFGPSTLKTLYKQRVRWTHGALENMIDYKKIFFNKKYGSVAFLTLPFTVVSLCSVVMLTLFFFWNIGNKIYQIIAKYMAIGFHFHFSFDPSFIYINTKTSIFIVAVLLSLTMTLLISSRRLTKEKIIPEKLVYFLFIYPLLAPLWIGRSVIKMTFRKKTSWR